MKTRPLADRFWEKVEIRGPDECWPWLGNRKKLKKSEDYGLFSVPTGHAPVRQVTAHRMAYELHYGRPLRNWGLHHCDNTLCCNPFHIYDGTALDNARDREVRHRQDHLASVIRGSGHANAKLTEHEVLEIRRRYAAGEADQYVLAQRFGISQQHISDIVRRKRWAHLETGDQN